MGVDIARTGGRQMGENVVRTIALSGMDEQTRVEAIFATFEGMRAMAEVHNMHIQHGWKVDVFNNDPEDSHPPDDPNHAERIINEATPFVFDETQNLGDGYFDIICGLPIEYVMYLRAEELVELLVQHGDNWWWVRIELDPR